MSWEKKNHGGEPTKNKDQKRAIFIGRYQPYHAGHISLVQQKLDDENAAIREITKANMQETNERIAEPESLDEVMDMPGMNKVFESRDRNSVLNATA